MCVFSLFGWNFKFFLNYSYCVILLFPESEECLRSSFSIGGDESDYDDLNVESKYTQTPAIQMLSPLRRLLSGTEPRSLEQCLELLRKDVCGILYNCEQNFMVKCKPIISFLDL